uniref:Alkylated DNA repair protein alkB-like protein n=1 Tax=Acartia pacifica TaxID=335913 RepID=A0A0U2URH4_ACAPC|nr:alkylated DNA repair protein alkB-like protein [Acartia pacifica]
MNTTRECGCKGHRSCLVCEAEYNIKPILPSVQLPDKVLYYHHDGDNVELERLGFHGIKLIPDFITETEETQLIKDLDTLPWDKSQSGRRKQNFGPRANFKKRKAKLGSFAGFPACTRFVQDRMEQVPLLAGYRTVEQCSIEYTPETGACIEPHIDDCWIWGERIVQLNMVSETYLSFVRYRGSSDKYNLKDVSTYPRIVDQENVVFNPFNSNSNYDTNSESNPFPVDVANPSKTDTQNGVISTDKETHLGDKECDNEENQVINDTINQNGGNSTSDESDDVLVKVCLPPRSLLIMYGSARYNWEHMILREDINTRRVIIAYREFTPPYLPGGELEGIGGDILNAATNFWTNEDTVAD